MTKARDLKIMSQEMGPMTWLSVEWLRLSPKDEAVAGGNDLLF